MGEDSFATYADLCRALQVDLPSDLAAQLEKLRKRGPGPLTADFMLDALLPLSLVGRHADGADDEPQDTIGAVIRAFEMVNEEAGGCLVPDEYLPIGRDADHCYYFLAGLKGERAGWLFGAGAEGQGMLDGARHDDFHKIAAIEAVLRNR